MNFEWNPNADKMLAAMVQRIVDALDSVVRDYSGHPVDEVRSALKQRWESANEGASITEPELTTVATKISEGKRVWLEDGKIMADD